MPRSTVTALLGATCALTLFLVLGRVAGTSSIAAATLALLGTAAVVMVAERFSPRRAPTESAESRSTAASTSTTANEDPEGRESASKASADALEPYRSVDKAEYLAGISHEIRTPLNGILGLTQLLMKLRPTSQQREYLELIRSSGDSLLRLINDILDHAKIRSGEIGFLSESFVLRKLVRETAKSFAPQAHLKELELAYWIDEDVPHAVVGDPNRLRQVLTNLLSNAIKFTDKGHVFLEASLDGESSEKGEMAIRFCVSDTGIGIPKESQQRIFESFAQGDDIEPQRCGGVGLGLTISAQLVSRMGGSTIHVESERGRGSRFSFLARFTKAEQSRPPDDAELLDGLCALVVDDSPLYREVLRRILRGWGIETVFASNRNETLELLAPRESAPGPNLSLFLLDSRIPGSDSWAIAREIQAQKQIPGVLMTQSHERVDTAKLRAHGFFGYLSKPVAPSHLHRAIEIILRGATVDSPEDVQTYTMDRLTLGGLRVLLAEDNPVNQRVATHMLEKAGCLVTVAENGAVALEKWGNGRYDIAVLDVQMPELDGIGVATAIRRSEEREGCAEGEKTPIVALTAHARPEDRDRCLEAGMNAFVSKPFREEDLVGTMEQLLAKRGRKRIVSAARRSAGTSEAPSSSTSTRSTASSKPPKKSGSNFDRGAALRRANGDPNLLAELTELFIDDSPKTLEALRIALGARDARTVEKLAHRLKGSLLTLSAERAAGLAASLENEASEGALSDCADLLFDLQSEIEHLNRELLGHTANVS